MESILPMMAIGEWSLPVLISTHEPFVIFFLPCPAEEGEWWSSFGGHLESSQG